MLFLIVAVAFAQVNPSPIGATVCNGAYCGGGAGCTDGSTCINGRCLQSADFPTGSIGGYCSGVSFPCAGASGESPAVTLTCVGNRCAAAIGQPFKGIGCPCKSALDCASGLCNATSNTPLLNDINNQYSIQTFCLASGLKNGAVCQHNSQCVSQICSGTCQAIPTGGVCAYISTNTFAPNVIVHTNPCVAGSYCQQAGTNAGTCQAYVTTSGGACTIGATLCAWPMYCNTGSVGATTGTCAAPGSVASGGACGVGSAANPPTSNISPSYFCASGMCGSSGANINTCLSTSAGIAVGSQCGGLFFSATGTNTQVVQGWDRLCSSGACDKAGALGSNQCVNANLLPYGALCAGNWDTTVCPSGSYCSREGTGSSNTYRCRRGSLRGSPVGGYCYNDDGCQGSDMQCIDNSCSVAYTGRTCQAGADCMSQYTTNFNQAPGFDANGYSLNQPTVAATIGGSYLNCECTKGGNVAGVTSCVTASATPCWSLKQAYVASIGMDYAFPLNGYWVQYQPYTSSAATIWNPSTAMPWYDPSGATSSITAQLMIAIAWTGTAAQKTALIAYLCCVSCASGSPGLDGTVDGNVWARAFDNRNSYIIRSFPGPLNCGSNSFGSWSGDDVTSRCSSQTPEIPYTNAIQCSSAFDVAPKVIVILAAAMLAVMMMFAH